MSRYQPGYHELKDRDLPDAGEGMCCMGAAVYGAGRCTCWEPEHDIEQAPIREDLSQPISERMCRDCAFRSDSPERNGDSEYSHSGEGDLEEMVASPYRFVCHQGMRRRIRLRHPAGVVHEISADAYDPPQSKGLAYRADGSPAPLCAGLVAARNKMDQQSVEGPRLQ